MIVSSRLSFLLPVVLLTATLPIPAFAAHEWANKTNVAHSAGIVEDGHDALLIRLHLIRSARRTLELQTFIWEDDASGRLIMEECIQAAKRGVKVRFLMDHHFSSIDFDSALALAQAHPNIEIKRYRPPFDRIRASKFRTLFHTALFFRAKNQRMHTKVVIADGSVALTGGRNLSNHYFGMSNHRNYHDRDIVVAGDVVQDFVRSFEEYWAHPRAVSLSDFKEIRRATERGETRDWDAAFSDRDKALLRPVLIELSDSEALEERLATWMQPVEDMELTVDPPRKNNRNGHLALWGGSPTGDRYLALIENAEKRITIQSTYFILNRKSKGVFRRLEKVRPNVDIRVSTNSYESTGNMLSYAGTLRARRPALSHGVSFHEFKAKPGDIDRYVPRFEELADSDAPFTSLHAKSLVIDGKTSYIGSFNFDPRSINLNTEIGVIVQDEEFAHRLERSIENDMAPRNSYVALRNNVPFAPVNRVGEWISFHLPINLWPFPSTSSFEVSPTGETTPIGFLPGYELFSTKLAKLHTVYLFVWATTPVL